MRYIPHRAILPIGYAQFSGIVYPQVTAHLPDGECEPGRRVANVFIDYQGGVASLGLFDGKWTDAIVLISTAQHVQHLDL